jgi:hypothetical protein
MTHPPRQRISTRALLVIIAIMCIAVPLLVGNCTAQIAHGQETPVSIIDTWCEGICQQDYLPIVTR